jgi:hypothetical protein
MGGWSEFEMKQAVFWDVARVEVVLADVSEERIASQKTACFIVTAVKTSNLTEFEMFENKPGRAL